VKKYSPIGMNSGGGGLWKVLPTESYLVMFYLKVYSLLDLLTVPSFPTLYISSCISTSSFRDPPSKCSYDISICLTYIQSIYLFYYLLRKIKTSLFNLRQIQEYKKIIYRIIVFTRIKGGQNKVKIKNKRIVNILFSK
jgi:hypothetical protein